MNNSNALLKVMLRTYFDLEFLMYAQLMIRLNGSFFQAVQTVKKCSHILAFSFTYLSQSFTLLLSLVHS